MEKQMVICIKSFLCATILSIILISSSCKLIKNKQKNSSCKKVEANIWIDNDEIFDHRNIDTTKSICLIFQEYFNDTLTIYYNDSIVITDVFRTIKNKSVTSNIINIDVKMRRSENNRIYIYDKNDCIYFDLKFGYMFYYVSRVSNNWSIDYSNCQRLFR